MTSEAEIYPLSSEWVWWYDRPRQKSNQSNWKDSFQQITVFTDVETFWRFFNNVPSPSDLSINCNYHFFRNGIFPDWEDEANKDGGKWVIEFDRAKGEETNKCWLKLLVGCIGDLFSNSDNICGCMMNTRKDTWKISVWLRENNEEAVLALGRSLKQMLELPASLQISYQVHHDCSVANRSFSGAKYTI
eukprot:TRINITY_DN12838_c0_g1_i1.p1 TRINITY_DN12838_c0_g1~~TRINITY_DN12838_c0_g1_i1.p1  ORF type:complete len:189 (+),score=37.84 TRINITY_DN12838_c0_g1_i1:63-629(+)